tara:strand:- start:386 stop:1744 length:1359 start_codon:yes stop_codon:yes gene_type:complete
VDNFFDLIVIGAGSGGLAAAKRAARYGARVAIIEGDRVGGTCVIRGCVPKKLLVYGSLYGQLIQNAKSFGVEFTSVKMNPGVLLANVRKEVDRLNDLHTKFLINAGIQIFSGWAKFNTRNSVLIRPSDENNQIRELRAKHILIAVGGVPRRPSIKGSSLGWVSDDMFLQKNFPKKIIIVGGGYIACEFACILNGLGVKVVQIVRGKNLLKEFDNELSLILQDQMQEKGIELHFDKTLISLEGEQGNIQVKTNLGENIQCGGVLFATGRKPFVEGLDLEIAGVKVVNGKIEVDKNNETNIPNIFAIGDVSNSINLTPVAVDEGRAFADSIWGGERREVNYELVPKAVFSQPEIASVGLSEGEAFKKLGGKIKVYRSLFKPMSQALPKSGEKCLMKLIEDTNSGKIVGCHMVGEHSAEIIQMASIPLSIGVKKTDFDRTMALHPTIAEEFVTIS